MLYQLFFQVLNMGIIACPVIITVLLIRGLMYHFPKKYRYFIWCIVGIRLICPFAVPSPVSLFNVTGTDWTSVLTMETDRHEADVKPNYDTSGSEAQNNHVPDHNVPANISGNYQENVSVNAQTGQDAIGSIQIPDARENQINPVIKYGSFIWVAGIMFILSWNFYSMLRMKKHLEKAVRFRKNIYECENIPSPFVAGILHPRIYIPFQLGKEEQAYILKHEQYHIKRRDHIIKPAAFLLVCIYWFHPLVWISYFLMVRDMEMSCDEYVLQNMDANIRKDYSMSLLSFATNQRGKAAGLLSFGETDTRKRVINVLNFKKHGKWIGILAIVLIITAGTACLTNAYDADKNSKKENENEYEYEKKEENEKKDVNDEKEKKEEAVVASKIIHGYDVQIVYMPDGKMPDKENLEFGMYGGKFAIKTYKDNVKCAEYPLEFDINDAVYYPAEGLELVIKDYDNDGMADDFALGQGQTLQPMLGNFMSYQIFTVDGDGSIARYALSTENGKSLLTVPGEYSPDFKCKDGKITYQALTEDGVKKQTISLSRIIPADNANEIKETAHSFYFENTGVTIGMPENKNWIQNPAAYTDDDTGIIKYHDGIAETDVTLYFGKKNQKEMLGFSATGSSENEYWSFFPGKYEELIEVQFHSIKKDITTVVLSWEYNRLYFFMCADFANPDDTGTAERNHTIEWTPLAKTAAYIAENWYNVLSATDKTGFSEDDIKTAKTAVKNYFKKVFPGCTIKKLWFDKDAYQRNVTYYSNLYGKDDMIILYSDFYVGKYTKDHSLEKDSLYTNFGWILSRNKNSRWKVETYGY